MEFMIIINENTYNLKFTMSCDQNTVNFLDTKIFVESDGSLGTSLYRKPSAGNALLHASSSHPRPLINSIPYSQYLRLQHNCSRDTDFQNEVNLLYGRLQERGYTHSILKKAFNRAKTHVRETLIHQKKAKATSQTEWLRRTLNNINK